MKKIVLALFSMCLFLHSYAIGSASPKNKGLEIRLLKEAIQKDNLTNLYVINLMDAPKGQENSYLDNSGERLLNKMKPFCRVSCTFTTTTADGRTFSYTATAGGLFTSCETAGEKACEKARLAAVMDFFF